MPYLQLDLDAKAKLDKVARATGTNRGDILWGATDLWEHVWRTKQAVVTDIVLTGCFGQGQGLLAALVAFEFLEIVDGGYRVRGSGRLLRAREAEELATEGRKLGGRLAAKNLRRGEKHPKHAGGEPGTEIVAPGSLPAPSRLLPGSSPASSASSQQLTAINTIAVQPKTVAPRLPSKAQEFFAWTQAEAVKSQATRVAESQPKPSTLNAQVKPAIEAIGVVGLEASWRVYLADAYAKERSWPWGLFVSQWQKYHNQAKSKIETKGALTWLG